jgi:hypothetical protein
MARPRELYNTPAPQAMSMMGQGIADAYARAGEIEGKGMLALGQGIAQGLTSAASSIAGAYGDYKKMQSQVKADSAAFNSFKDYLPAEFVNKQQALENDPSASLLDKQQFYQSAKGYLGAAIGQKYKMDQIGAEVGGRMLAAQAGKEPTPDLAGLGQGLRQATGVAAPAPEQPAAPAMQFDVTAPVQKLQDFMSKKYGPDYKLRGIKASAQDVMDAGL